MGNTIIDSASNYNVIDIINKGLAYAIIAAGLLSVIFIFVGGFSLILSGGNEEKIKSAVGTIRYSIIGLIITILAVVIVGTVGRLIGLDIIRYINFNDVIANIQTLTTNIQGTSSSGGNVSLD
ncbi:MAG: hypothetical protein ACRCZE_03065 [Candidatus Altimarinota bacterium]